MGFNSGFKGLNNKVTVLFSLYAGSSLSDN